MARQERADELCWLPATTLASMIKRRKVSPVEVVNAALARIDAINPILNAYVTVTAEQARRDARAAERALGKRGARLGPLHGVPFSVKDLVITRGVRTTFGTPLYRDNVPTEDAPVVARLKAAGGIMLGKTNTPTMGWIGATHNLLFGITRNPWNLDRTPGGSSGGASAAAAAGLGPLHVGTDGGGSIRIPASCAGIFGFKASYGRVPIHPASGAWSLSHVGPMTRTVADAALMLNACAGPDECDQYSLPAERGDYVKALGGRSRAGAWPGAMTWVSPTVSIPTWRRSARGRRAPSASWAAAWRKSRRGGRRPSRRGRRSSAAASPPAWRRISTGARRSIRAW
jgi:Asp-tRNA(Asn)/Glu-tRNA(Gln) amidotransferase A subunit family amidase